MVSIQVQLDDETGELVRRLAAAQDRSECDIVRDAVVAYAQAGRPMPKGIGQFHSGRQDVSETARNILRDAVKEGRWP